MGDILTINKEDVIDMFIKDIRNPFFDEGISTLKLQTPTRTIEGLFRAFNGPEIRTWKQHNNNDLNLPSSIVEFTGNPTKHDVERLTKKGVIIKYFPRPNMPFSLDFSKAVIKNQLDNGFQIIGVPDFNENFMEFRRKLDEIPDTVNDHPNGSLCSIMPYIRSNHETKIFEKRLFDILERGYNMIGIDIHGINKLNLEYMKEVLKKRDADYWIHASNIPKKYDSTSRAAYAHILTYLGVHTYTLREGRPTYFKGLKSENTEHFDSQSLGIVPWTELPSTFGIDCTCKYHNHGGQYYTDDVKEIMGRSRIHEMVNGMIELKRAEITIREGIFEQYIKNKTCAVTALFKNNY